MGQFAGKFDGFREEMAELPSVTYLLFHLAVNQRPLRCHYIVLRVFIPRTSLAYRRVRIRRLVRKARDNAHAMFALR